MEGFVRLSLVEGLVIQGVLTYLCKSCSSSLHFLKNAFTLKRYLCDFDDVQT